MPPPRCRRGRSARGAARGARAGLELPAAPARRRAAAADRSPSASCAPPSLKAASPKSGSTKSARRSEPTAAAGSSRSSCAEPALEVGGRVERVLGQQPRRVGDDLVPGGRARRRRERRPSGRRRAPGGGSGVGRGGRRSRAGSCSRDSTSAAPSTSVPCGASARSSDASTRADGLGVEVDEDVAAEDQVERRLAERRERVADQVVAGERDERAQPLADDELLAARRAGSARGSPGSSSRTERER